MGISRQYVIHVGGRRVTNANGGKIKLPIGKKYDIEVENHTEKRTQCEIKINGDIVGSYDLYKTKAHQRHSCPISMTIKDEKFKFDGEDTIIIFKFTQEKITKKMKEIMTDWSNVRQDFEDRLGYQHITSEERLEELYSEDPEWDETNIEVVEVKLLPK